MATGASTADLAVLLVDARKGILPQTKRHSRIVHLLGIRRLVLAVNKMDLAGYDRARFEAIVADYAAFAAEAGIDGFAAIPMSGLAGDNVTHRGARMAWHDGPTLLEHLEDVPIAPESGGEPGGFRLPVQWVNRPGQDFRGYAGTIASGRVAVGDPVRVLPSGRASRVARIVTFDGDLAEARAGQAVTLVLADDVDCARGDMIAGAGAETPLAGRIDARLIWMASEPLVPGRSYWLKIGPLTVAASIARLAEEDGGAPGTLGLNDIGGATILLDRPIAATTYARSRRLGGFILIDRATHATLAAGMIDGFPDGGETPARNGGGRIIRLTGGEGQSGDIARQARDRLRARGRGSFVLDRAALADGLASDLGAGPGEDAEFARRAAEAARLLSRAGVTVLLAPDIPAEAALGPELNLSDPSANWDWII
jgi:bifunctional enzyme CysN/CysC